MSNQVFNYEIDWRHYYKGFLNDNNHLAWVRKKFLAKSKLVNAINMRWSGEKEPQQYH
jgi:hypothetical protein